MKALRADGGPWEIVRDLEELFLAGRLASCATCNFTGARHAACRQYRTALDYRLFDMWVRYAHGIAGAWMDGGRASQRFCVSCCLTAGILSLLFPLS
jgi:hypothetical protein